MPESREGRDMDNLLTVALEAHHAAKNHHRHYQVTVGRPKSRSGRLIRPSRVSLLVTFVTAFELTPSKNSRWRISGVVRW
jgi:hypothetical protein